MRRALQEALSNSRKHAPDEPVHVVLDWRSDGMAIQVRNRMAGAGEQGSVALAASGGGHGLAGMAERFGALEGGSVSTRQCGGDFVVRAELGRQERR
jgi:signal transduction histidine kinase